MKGGGQCFSIPNPNRIIPYSVITVENESESESESSCPYTQNEISSVPSQNKKIEAYKNSVVNQIVNDAVIQQYKDQNAANPLVMLPEAIITNIINQIEDITNKAEVVNALRETCVELYKATNINDTIGNDKNYHLFVAVHNACNKFMTQLKSAVTNLKGYEMIQLTVIPIITYSYNNNQYLYVTNFATNIFYDRDNNIDDAEINFSDGNSVDSKVEKTVDNFFNKSTTSLIQKIIQMLICEKDVNKITTSMKKDDNDNFSSNSFEIQFYINIFDYDLRSSSTSDQRIESVIEQLVRNNFDLGSRDKMKTTLKRMFSTNPHLLDKNTVNKMYMKARTFREILEVITWILDNSRNSFCIKNIKYGSEESFKAAAPDAAAKAADAAVQAASTMGGNLSRNKKPVLVEQRVIHGKKRNVYKIQKKLYVKQGKTYVSLKEFEKQCKEKERSS